MELEPLTVLVGPNASGKTTLLEGMELVSQVGTSAIGERIAEFVNWKHAGIQSYGVDDRPALGISGIWSGTTGTMRIISGEGANKRLAPARVPAFKVKKGEGFSISGEWAGKAFPNQQDNGGKDGGVLGSVLESFRAALRSTTVLSLEPHQLAGASYSEDALPSIQSDGSGLASVLAHLKLSQDEIFEGIEQALREIVPAVRRIRIERAQVEQTAIRTISVDDQRHELPETRTIWGNKVVMDMKGARGVPADAVGEGTIMALGLLTVLMGPLKPRLVLLDDVELSLHPAAQAKLVGVLRAIQKQDPELQIIATSHSPFILNYLAPQEVRMTFLGDDGFARCEKLTAHPEFEQWKELMRPGEFWSTVGERWITESGTPVTHE